MIDTGRAGMIHARDFAFGRVLQAALVSIVEPAEPHGKAVPGLFSIRLRTTSRLCRSAVALPWSAAKDHPVTVYWRQQGDLWTFLRADRKVTLDWKSGEARLAR